MNHLHRTPEAARFNPADDSLTLGHWLRIEACYAGFDDCDTIQIEVNEDTIEVDVNRIPELIAALQQVLALNAGGAQ